MGLRAGCQQGRSGRAPSCRCAEIGHDADGKSAWLRTSRELKWGNALQQISSRSEIGRTWGRTRAIGHLGRTLPRTWVAHCVEGIHVVCNHCASADGHLLRRPWRASDWQRQRRLVKQSASARAKRVIVPKAASFTSVQGRFLALHHTHTWRQQPVTRARSLFWGRSLIECCASLVGVSRSRLASPRCRLAESSGVGWVCLGG